MKTRAWLALWFTSLMVCLSLYILSASPVLVLTRHSHSPLTMTAVEMYSPIFFARSHSDFVDKFFALQWEFWFKILG